VIGRDMRALSVPESNRAHVFDRMTADVPRLPKRTANQPALTAILLFAWGSALLGRVMPLHGRKVPLVELQKWIGKAS
jgi:hypothetical protein